MHSNEWIFYVESNPFCFLEAAEGFFYALINSVTTVFKIIPLANQLRDTLSKALII